MRSLKIAAAWSIAAAALVGAEPRAHASSGFGFPNAPALVAVGAFLISWCAVAAPVSAAGSFYHLANGRRPSDGWLYGAGVSGGMCTAFSGLAFSMAKDKGGRTGAIIAGSLFAAGAALAFTAMGMGIAKQQPAMRLAKPAFVLSPLTWRF